jgi:hypothetical protein
VGLGPENDNLCSRGTGRFVTIWDLGAAALRRWYLAVAGLMCIATACLLALSNQGVYFVRTEAVFLPPSDLNLPNNLMNTSPDAVTMAGAVARRINGADTELKLASPDATIVGRGVSDGFSVALPDSGGQWTPSFGRQLLDVQVVGPNHDEVQVKLDVLVQRIRAELYDLQASAGVMPSNMVTIQQVPISPTITYMDGAPINAIMMLIGLGVPLLTAAIAVLDRAMPRRASARDPRSDADRSAWPAQQASRSVVRAT